MATPHWQDGCSRVQSSEVHLHSSAGSCFCNVHSLNAAVSALQLVILAVPGEFTTMAGRRLRAAVYDKVID